MNRYSALFCFTLAISFATTSRADVTFTEGKDGGEAVIRMTVTPAAEPVPALHYRLVPRDLELKPGNRAIYYYRAQLDLRGTMKTLREKFDEDTQLSLWETAGHDATPIAKLPLEKVRAGEPSFRRNVRRALRARVRPTQLRLAA